MHPQLTRFSGSSLRLLLSVIYLLLTLFLAGCGSLDASSSTHNSTPTTSTTGNTTPTTAEQTATASATSTPTAAPTQGGTTPAATATPAPVPFEVTGVAFGAWPGDHQGVCRTNTFFTASVLIYAPAHTTGGTVTVYLAEKRYERYHPQYRYIRRWHDLQDCDLYLVPERESGQWQRVLGSLKNTFARGAHHSSDHLSPYLSAPGAEYQRHGFADPRLQFGHEDLHV